MYIYPLEILLIVFIILRHKKENIMHAYKVLLVYVNYVLSVAISAKFQRPLIKQYNFATRWYRK